jgi:hypothetical protein
VIEPVEGLFDGALDALLEHLSGTIEAGLPADGAVLQRIQQLVQGMRTRP